MRKLGWHHSPVLDEELHNSGVAIFRCQLHRVIVYIRAVLDEELHHSCVTIQ